MQRWELSAWLRDLRREADLTIEQVAAALACSPAKVSRMEAGLRGVQPRDVRDLSLLYKLTRENQERLASLARGAREKGWYDGYDVPPAAAEFYGLEAGASEFRWVEPLLVPGVLQTRGYSEALLELLATLEEFPELRVADQLEIRKLRQRRLWDGEACYRFVIAEVALVLKVGDPTVMEEQMGQLLLASSLENVSLRLLRSDKGLGPATMGSFTLLGFNSGMPNVLFREQANFTSTAERHVVERYVASFAALEHDAESVEQSRSMVRDVRDLWATRRLRTTG